MKSLSRRSPNWSESRPTENNQIQLGANQCLNGPLDQDQGLAILFGRSGAGPYPDTADRPCDEGKNRRHSRTLKDSIRSGHP